MLNARGGIESDLTVTRLSETAFLLWFPVRRCNATSPGSRGIWATAFVTITDMTAAEAVFCVMGPNARSSMQDVPRRFDQRGLPFGTAREIEIGMGLARAHRISYVGELGWELYVSTDRRRMCSRR
jgi:glycine cleavage system aminomethyltransferase T